MDISLSEYQASMNRQLSSACDTCHRRKVRCDRNYPCGNCQDQETLCTHHRQSQRLPRRSAYSTKRKSKSSRTNFSPANTAALTQSPAQGPAIYDGKDHSSRSKSNLKQSPQIVEQQLFGVSNIMNRLHSWISLIPLTDAQLENRQNSDCLGDLALTRRQALESALYVADQISGRVRALENILEHGAGVEQHAIVPSAELLAWIVTDVGSNRFGSYVLDHFKFVSILTLKHMGQSLLQKKSSPVDSILYTICVNAFATKFLNTILLRDDFGELAGEIRTKASQHQSTALRALRAIPLLTKPSLALLQAVLCGIFLHQRSGDTQLCSDLTLTACRICAELDLPNAVHSNRVTEEEYYCVLWCYMLDRSYAWKLGRSRCFLDFNTGATEQDSLANNYLSSELLQVHIRLAQVQDSLIPFLRDLTSSSDSGNGITSFSRVQEHLTSQMEEIRFRIDQVSLPSPKWKGLDPRSVTAALNFTYHSVMTTIYHLSQVISGQPLEAGELYLQSARKELTALVSLCLSSDNENTTAFLHSTLLYWPPTACLVLFCNAVAASHPGDFTLLKEAANCLCGSMNRPGSSLQCLFQELVSLSQGFFVETTSAISVNNVVGQLRTAHTQETSQGSSMVPVDLRTGNAWSQDTHDQVLDPSALMLNDILSHEDFDVPLGADFGSL